MNKLYYDSVLANNARNQKLDFDSSDSSRFWVPMRYKNRQTHREEVRGQVKIQVDVLPIDYAIKNKVGKARDEPNHSPKLPEPEGRIQLTLNPFEMYKQLIGPEIRNKICMYLIGCVCFLMYLALIPTITGSVVGGIIDNLINPPDKKSDQVN